MKCLKCGSENSVGAKFCRGCGSDLNALETQSVVTVTTASCTSCGKANLPGKKFCSKCGASMTAQGPQPVEQPQQVATKMASSTSAEEFNSCPRCGNSLKQAVKFCGKCGLGCEQKSYGQAAELNKVISTPTEAVDVIQLQNNTAAATVAVSSPAVAKVEVQQAKSPVEQVPPQASVSESVKKGPSGLIVVVIILWVCAIGGGSYWWFGLRQVAPSPVADAVNAQPAMAVVTPASAVAAVSEPVATLSVAEHSPSAVVSPAVNPVRQPEPQAALTSLPKKSRTPHVNGSETNDDRKLLNAIDQYLDNQK